MGAVRLDLWFGLLDVDIEEPRLSDLSAFRQGKGVLYIDAKVPDRALDLRVPEQDLNGPEVPSLLVNDGRLGPPERVRPVILPMQPNARHPLVHEPGVLPSADVSRMVDPAREGEVVERAAPTLKPSKDACAGRFKKLELNGPASLTLDDDGPGADLPATDEIADPDLHDVAAAQFAVDRQIEQRSVSDPSLLV